MVLKPFAIKSGSKQVRNRSQDGTRLPPNHRNLTTPRVARSGQDIPAIFEQRLNIAAYGADIFTSIGIQVTAATFSRSRLSEFKSHKQMINKHNDT